jgi:cytochrome d ubiquinol oxidase subunit II
MSMVWSALILLCLLMYVLLDGYDLGLGVAMLFERDGRHRRQMLEQVAQAWDGNETWLVLLAVSLWAGFPLAFGTILPHAYLALVVMLFSLVVRGVSVEMASQAPAAPRWERAFAIASLFVALSQGVVLATLTEKLAVVNGAFSGSSFGSIGWFALPAAATVTSLYLAMGYAYTKLHATGELRATSARRGLVSTVVAAALIAVSLGAVNATAAPLDLHTPGRAIGFVGLLLFAAAGLGMAVVTLRPASSYDALPLAGLTTAVVALLIAVVVARAPVIVPPSLTVANSVSPGTTMVFLAVGVGLNVPLLLFYSWFSHHAFGRPASSAGDSPTRTLLGATDGHH